MFPIVAVVLAAILGWRWYTHSSSYQVRHAIAAARAQEARDPVAAAAAWEDVITRWDGQVEANDLAPAAEAVVRLALAGVHQPIGVADVEAARQAIARCEQLPDDLRAFVRARVFAAVSAWVDALGQDDAAHARAGLRLVDELARVDPDAELDTRRVALRRALATALAPDEPVGTLRLCFENRADPVSLRMALTLLDPVQHSPSLLLDLDDVLDPWLGVAADDQATRERAHDLRAAVTAARARRDDAARAKLLAEPDEAGLRKALAQAPSDQELTVALAQILVARGDSAGALALLRAFGKPGALVGSARVLYAQLVRERGDLAGAESALAGWLDWRLPPFQEAAQRYVNAQTELRQKLVDELKSGNYDRSLDERARGLDQQKQQELVASWIEAHVDADESLKQLRTNWERHMDVVPASLLLGQVRLERARGASGAQREALLAGAEQAYLGVQLVAGNAPEYHIGLGQVYYRLGRVADGEKELAGVRASAAPATLLALADVYLDLGMDEQARAIAEPVADDEQAGDVVRDSAAVLLAMIARDDGEREKWLRRSHAEQAHIELVDLEGEHLLRDGRDAEADAKFAEVASHYGKSAAHSAVASNNQANLLSMRFLATGEVRFIDEAVASGEAAVRLAPNDALCAHGLARTLIYRGVLRVLDAYAEVRRLRPRSDLALDLLEMLSAGTQREAVRAKLRADASIRRGLELLRRQQTLAPQDPDAYLEEQELLDLLGDEAGLRALDARVEPLSGFSTAERSEQHRRWIAGGLDGMVIAVLKGDVERFERVAGQAVATPRTRALAGLMLAELLVRWNIFQPEVVHAERPAAAVRAALALAPELGTSALVEPLLLAACERAVDGDDELAKAFHEARRHLSVPLAAWLIATSARGAAFLARLRAQPELAQAAASADPAHATRSDWILAWLLGDAARTKAASSAFDDARAALVMKIRVHVLADDPDEALRARFLAARGAPAPASH